MNDLKGKNAVVIGASSGIGRALALALAREGMNVAVAGTRRELLESVAAEIRSLGVKALPIACDVSERSQMRALADRCFAEFGKVHLLCNNAGVTTVGPLAEHTDEDWDWMVGVGLLGVAHAIQAFVPRMIRQGEGHILNTGSQAGLVPDWVLNHGPYTSAKAGVTALSTALRPELAPHGIGVSLLIPSYVPTDIVRMSGQKRPARYGGPKPGVEEGMPSMREGAPLPIPDTRFALEADEVAEIAIRGIKANRAFIVTHGGLKPVVEDYFRRILYAYDIALAEEKGAN